MSRSYLSQVENGRKEPGFPLLKAASGLYGIPLALLVVDENGSEKEIVSELQRLLADVLAVKTHLASKRMNREASPE